ncbi:PREDICTED: odorant receptor 82a-like [Wasmannia auropunctata]|uniref:odorant receptor 82a-like n=1 Tax=Wasmannia auropunctata TaxID=64793 RepID=UPI0005F0BF10|nr:PREDICTED: odorant receptor 82a-like [Wasmannia auropunctata]
MWPDSAYPNLYWFSYMTSVAIVQYYQYAYILTHFDLNNLWLLMDCLSLTLAYSLAFLKLIVLWWNRRKSPIFECFLIGQFLYDMVIAFVVGLINALLVALVLHVSGQIDIMQQDLIEISNGKYDHNIFLSVIKDLICKHQKIITLSENIENLYTNIALIQVLWNTLVMCCTGFVIVIVLSNGKDTTNLIKSVSYYTVIILEVFVYCFAGEFLSAKSNSIGDAVYKSLWYNMSPSDSRIILFMILRCQKRLTITAGRVIDLTLEGFTNIMKATVSYISVLNAMY